MDAPVFSIRIWQKYLVKNRINPIKNTDPVFTTGFFYLCTHLHCYYLTFLASRSCTFGNSIEHCASVLTQTTVRNGINLNSEIKIPKGWHYCRIGSWFFSQLRRSGIRFRTPNILSAKRILEQFFKISNVTPSELGS
jgi:hypothetical protein